MDLDLPEDRLQAAMEGLPLLTIDLVRDRAKEGLMLVTCANWQYYDFVLNWVGHLRKIGVTNFLIGTFPLNTQQKLKLQLYMQIAEAAYCENPLQKLFLPPADM